MSDYAVYTQTFHDFYEDYGEDLDEYITMSTDERTASFKSMLHALWDEYEIAGETPGQQIRFMAEVFDEYVDYYEEIITNYEVEFDLKTALTRTTESEDVIGQTGSSTTKNTGTSAETGWEWNTNDKTDTSAVLPNKKIAEDDMFDYPDSGLKTEQETLMHDGQDVSTSSNITSSSQSDLKNTNTGTITDNTLFVQMKNAYLRQIRNVYREFANKFKDCFIHLFI